MQGELQPSTCEFAEAPVPLAATPVSFGSSSGFFMPARNGARNQAVLFLSPWGFEELSIRKFWRSLADDFAAAGISSLRFDLPGTGNALDLPEAATLSHWQDAVVGAAETLRKLSGAENILLIGQGFGAALGATVWHRLGPLSGTALLAPVLSGRLHLREMAVWARITDGMPDPEKELKAGRGFWISGFRLADGICQDLRGLDISATPPPPCKNALVVARPERPAEKSFADHLASQGVTVTVMPYEGYDRLVGNLNFSEQPRALMAGIIDWALQLPAEGTRSSEGIPKEEPRLEGDGFVETPVRFGPNGRLVGTLCQPLHGNRTGATVIMLSTAYQPGSGWGRIAVDAARTLARQGVPSLRYDAANTSDSPPMPGAPEQILYSPAQGLDVEAALDVVRGRNLLPAIIGGRCSGGYLAFRSLLDMPDLKGAICANPYVFYWDGSQSVEDLLRFVPKPLGNYGSMLFRGSTWKRILCGEVNLKFGLINIGRLLTKRLLHASETVLTVFPFLSHEYREVRHAFATLKDRGAILSLLYADDDPGMAHLTQHFGDNGRKLEAFDNVSIQFLANTDHNLSTPEAREIFVSELLAMAKRFPPV